MRINLLGCLLPQTVCRTRKLVGTLSNRDMKDTVASVRDI